MAKASYVRRRKAEYLKETRILLQEKCSQQEKDKRLGDAARQCYCDAVRVLLKGGANPNSENDDGATPLYRACRSDFAEYHILKDPKAKLGVLKLLLDHGADPNAQCRAHLGWTPLNGVSVCQFHGPALARILYDYGADLDAEDDYCHTALHFARQRHKPDVVRELKLLSETSPPRRGCEPWRWLDIYINKEEYGLFWRIRMWFARRACQRAELATPAIAARQTVAPCGENDRAGWDQEQYAKAIVRKVSSWRPGEDCGLYAHEDLVRTLGQEINGKWGLEGMQEVFSYILRLGVGPTSALSRIWNGVGQWQN